MMYLLAFPSYPAIRGKSSRRRLNWTSAPRSRHRLMLLRSLIGPVSHVPGGTVTVPPPALATDSIAAAKALVFRVCPSGTPPHAERLTVRSGNRGTAMAGIVKGRSTHCCLISLSICSAFCPAKGGARARPAMTKIAADLEYFMGAP